MASFFYIIRFSRILSIPVRDFLQRALVEVKISLDRQAERSPYTLQLSEREISPFSFEADDDTAPGRLAQARLHHGVEAVVAPLLGARQQEVGQGGHQRPREQRYCRFDFELSCRRCNAAGR